MFRHILLLAAVGALLGSSAVLGQNADTVDGFHAYGTPHANALLALDGGGHFPISVIPDNSIPGSKLAFGAVTSGRLRDRAVTASKIVPGVVTNSKLANQAVTAGKLAYGAVTAGRLANNSVTTEKITNGQVMAADLAA